MFIGGVLSQISSPSDAPEATGRVPISDGDRTYTLCRKHANAYQKGASFMSISQFLQKRAEDEDFKRMTDQSVLIPDESITPTILKDTVNQGVCSRC